MTTNKETNYLTLAQLIKGHSYRAVSPKGDDIIGTYDLVPACARADTFTYEGPDDDDGLTPEYCGDTDCYWDGQYTERDDNGKTFYQCREGNMWTAGALKFIEEAESAV